MFKYAGSPMADQVSADWQDKVMHSTLTLGDSVLMGADPPPNSYEAPKGFQISVNPGSVEEAERVFTSLSAGGKILMPLQQTFWARRFGVLVDRFGIPWMVNCEQPA
jgi:PhnB protein